MILFCVLLSLLKNASMKFSGQRFLMSLLLGELFVSVVVSFDSDCVGGYGEGVS